MTPQVKDAIIRLKQAGFSRNEFSVQVDRHYCGQSPQNGKPCYEYGQALIVIWAKANKQFDLVPAMLEAGLSVRYHLYDGKLFDWPFIKNDGKGILELWDKSDTSRSPLGNIRQISHKELEALWANTLGIG